MPRSLGNSQLSDGQNEPRAGVLDNKFRLLEVNPIEIIFRNHVKDSFGERVAVLRSDRTGEVAGTRPSTDGDTSHRIVLLSQLDKLGDEGGPRPIETEDGGVRGGLAENVCISV